MNEHGYDGGDPEIVHAKDVSGTTTPLVLPPDPSDPKLQSFSSFGFEGNAFLEMACYLGSTSSSVD